MAERTKGTSLAKAPVGIIGIILLVGGILGLLFGSTDFTTAPIDGDVSGDTFLGIEGNGWTWLLFAAAGAILLLSAPLHWGAKTMALAVGLVLGAASVISIIDGSDVFGVFAANGPTMLAFGAAATALLLVALLPRTRGRRVEERPVREEPRNSRFERDESVAAESAGRRRS